MYGTQQASCQHWLDLAIGCSYSPSITKARQLQMRPVRRRGGGATRYASMRNIAPKVATTPCCAACALASQTCTLCNAGRGVTPETLRELFQAHPDIRTVAVARSTVEWSRGFSLGTCLWGACGSSLA